MIPSFASSPVYDMSTGIYYTTGATAVIPTPAYELIPHRVFVGGFPASTTELELREHFEQFFTIKEVKVIRSADGVSKGYGFITFDTDDEADTVRGMSPEKLEFKGRKLNLGPALRRMSQRYSTVADYAIATPTGLVQSPTYGYTYSFPPQPPFVMVNTPQAYVYTPGSPVPQAMIYPVAAPANTNAEQPAGGGTNGAVTTPDSSPTRNQPTVQNAEVVVPVAAKVPATPPATAASSSVSVVTAPVPVQQPQPCIQYPVYLQPQAPPTPVTPTVVAHPRGSPTNVYNSHMASVHSAPYFSTPDGHGVPYQQTFYYNNTPMAAAGDAANMQMMYGNGAPPGATPLYGATEYTPPPNQQHPHDSPPIAQGLFTPSPHHGSTPQVVYEGGRFVRAAPRAVMSLNGQFQSMRVSNEHPKNSPSEALRAQTTPPESPQF
uniref:RRM domain-containing protein n=1 Tax=Haemonchus contortus TaxID=6289 RepID=A0A7I5E8V6_HAECO